jgi:hypothetical protein
MNLDGARRLTSLGKSASPIEVFDTILMSNLRRGGAMFGLMESLASGVWRENEDIIGQYLAIDSD